MSTRISTSTRPSRRTRVKPTPARDGSRPTVSVVIPCYNYAQYLPDAVRSVLSQTGIDVDVIIVDDASNDGSLEVARELAAVESRIKVVAHQVNRGAVATFNDGLPEVTGEFLVRLDADDLLTPGSLVRSCALATACPSVGLVYGRPRHFEGVVPTRYRSKVRGWSVWKGETWLAGRCVDGLNVITSPEVLMRTAVVREVGGQQPLAHTHDMEMWFRIAAFSDVGYVEGPEQAWHREHGGSLSAEMSHPLDDMIERRAAFKTLFSGMASSLPGAVDLHAAARRALALHALRNACHEYDRQMIEGERADDYREFALTTFPEIVTTSMWAALEKRRSLGYQGVRSRPWFYGMDRARRVQGIIRDMQWKRAGTYDGR